MNDNKKTPEGREHRDILTIRMPCEINDFTKTTAEKLGISQNALLMMLIDLGIKVYEGNFSLYHKLPQE